MGDRVFRLENDSFIIFVSPKGAELQGLYSKNTQIEYLWQPGHEIWPHHSMLLFPSPGRVADDRTIIGGKVYPATMHGFVNDMEFQALEADASHLLLQLEANEQTRKSFPYEFCLQVEFLLKEDALYQTIRVINRDDKCIYFSLGAHPGFYCPIVLGEKAESYVLAFDVPQDIYQLELQENTRLLTGKRTPYLQNQTEIPLGNAFFDDGPKLLENIKASTITLKSKESSHFVEIGIEKFPYLCLWGTATRMSLICVEPWCGVSDSVDTDHIWETKQGIESVDVGDVFERTMTFRIG